MTRGLMVTAIVVVLARHSEAADAELEKQFRNDVAHASVDAAAAFERANAARDAARFDEAVAEYRKAVELRTDRRPSTPPLVLRARAAGSHRQRDARVRGGGSHRARVSLQQVIAGSSACQA